MPSNKNYLQINDSICCRFNLSVRSTPQSALGLSLDGHGVVNSNSDSSNSAADSSGGTSKYATNPAVSVGSSSGNGVGGGYYGYGGADALYLHDNNYYYHHIYQDDVYYMGANVTWADVRQITANFTDDVTVYCDVNNTPQAHNLSDVNFSIVSEVEYLGWFLGDRYISTAAVVVLSILYTLIFLSGVLGNVCTCVVIARNRFLHTATNYYLFSLAISDVMTLILALPQEMSTIWEAYPFIFGTGFCIIKSFVSEMTAYASVLTITAFTIDRYVAICHPLRSQALSSLSRAVKIIILIWVIACVCALPYPIHTRMFHEVFDPCTGEPLPDSYLCNIPAQWRHRMKYMFQFSTFAFFVVPLFIITIMYIFIGLALMKTDQFASGKKNKQAAIAAAKAKKAVLKMLVAVVIAFFLCWAPFHTQRLMTIYVPADAWTDNLLQLQTYIFYISGVLYFFSSTVNPILYNVMSKRYRKAFRRTLYRCINGKSYEYSETSIFRSTPHSTSVTVYTNHRLLVKDRTVSRSPDPDVNSSTTV
ncbi:pyrokinin-1 receptor [Aplysia californica]|uniref:Pyrokinin-1 receptor n=1 Tax=Aplysia californica TaxID=6500 RepID=A0ABM1A2L6_APLCA|nr:pyrokinin-1 receptor [Aplysia californica]